MIAAALLALTVQAAPQTEAAPKHVDLFDGKTLDGWVGDERFWKVRDGMIIGESTPMNPCEETTYLRLDGREFADFDLEVEYRIDGGNSGISFRGEHTEGYEVVGYHADLDAENVWTGGLYDVGGRGVINRRCVRMRAAGGRATLYELLGDPEELSEIGGPGEWHTYRIRCEASRITLWIDGTLMCVYDDFEPEADASGILALQLHEGAPMRMLVRAIRLTELDGPMHGLEEAGSARWIWRRGAQNESGVVRFERRLIARGKVERATLWATCDDGVEFSFRDVVFAGSEDVDAPFLTNIRPRFARMLTGGKPYTLTAECWNSGGPAGFIARLVLYYDDGTTDVIETDRWWRINGQPAEELGYLGIEPWGVPTKRGHGTPDLPLAAEKIALPAGFEAKEILRVPRGYGSWAAMTVDDEGRLICCAENGPGIYRVTLNDEGVAADVEQLDIEMHAAQGLAARGRDLYIVRNAWPVDDNGLYRARDTNGDDEYDELEYLTPLDGGGEHGPHAVRFTPDGKHLELIAGNSTRVPAEDSRYAMVPAWHKDQLLPSLPDTFGHGNQMHLHGGWLGRCDLDGKNWEILCAGMRNTYDFAYGEGGERFGYDADMEWDIGAPWYRAPRVLHLVPGAEFGWRRGSGKIMDDEPDNFGHVCETGPSSPTGVVHGRNGGFRGKWRDRLYVGDWTRGAIYSIAMSPDGDTYTGEWEEFLKGTPMPITDLAWLKDGSLAVSIGGRGNRSALYRVTCTLPKGASAPPREALGSTGRRATLAKRLAFERNEDVASWANRALVEGDDEARLALARVGGAGWQERLLASIAGQDTPLDHDDLRACELTLARNGVPTSDAATALRGRLESIIAIAPSVEPIPNEPKIVELLVALGSEHVAAFAVPRMEAATTQERMIDLAMSLRRCEAGWTDALARRALDVLHASAGNLRGGQSIDGYVERCRNELAERVSGVLEGEYEPPAKTATAARELETPTFVKHWDITTLARSMPNLANAKNRELGELSFERAGCYTCHRHGDKGGGTGPDLTNAASRFTARDLLFALIEPSKDISDQYRDTEVWTTDGEVYVGRLESKTADMVTLRLPPSSPGGTDGDLVDIETGDIKVERPHPNSRMPAGTVDCLTSEEIVEMIAWLLDGQ